MSVAQNQYCYAAAGSSERQPVSGGALTSSIVVANSTNAAATVIRAALRFFKSVQLVLIRNLELQEYIVPELEHG